MEFSRDIKNKIQGLEFGLGTNMVSFTRVTNIVSDSRYTAGGSEGALEAPPLGFRGKA